MYVSLVRTTHFLDVIMYVSLVRTTHFLDVIMYVSLVRTTHFLDVIMYVSLVRTTHFLDVIMYVSLVRTTHFLDVIMYVSLVRTTHFLDVIMYVSLVLFHKTIFINDYRYSARLSLRSSTIKATHFNFNTSQVTKTTIDNKSQHYKLSTLHIFIGLPIWYVSWKGKGFVSVRRPVA